ncbi:MAG: glycoside hydrolase family 2 protein [Omnitrophica WOR_2 bacterium]
MIETISFNGPWLFKGFLGADWELRNAHKPESTDRTGWLEGIVPGSVQHDLWQNQQIPDPYFERNSLLIEWAPERTWVYRRAFNLGAEYQGKRLVLYFKGIDYQAQIYLNGELLGEHTGMYTPVSFEVGERIKYGGENLLAVVIAPAPQEQPQVGYTSRVRTHKSRMTYWWDFCPRMVHVGIWDGVYLEASEAVKIEDVFIQPVLNADLSHARVLSEISLSTRDVAEAEVEITIRHNGQEIGRQVQKSILNPGKTVLRFDVDVANPELWWPNGHGEQPLYQAEVRASLAGMLSDQRRVSFGIRKVEFVSNEGAERQARPYTLVVNGQRIYIQGWNWVPIDVLYGVERPEKLERLLILVKEAHVNLLRVWGGGLIEKDAFYDLCDRLGLMIWQEFIQSSSGIDNLPPEDPEFIDWMVEQARQIIPLKRNHPSLALWCGGNELAYRPEQPCDDRHPMLAALKAVVEELDPGRGWLPTTPSGRVFSNSIDNIVKDPLGLHDVHGPWEHQGLEKHQLLYNQGTSLLHSEFGVEGITNRHSLDRVIARDHQWPVSLDNPAWFHLGAWWLKEGLWKAVFGDLPDLETTIEALQFLQADGLRYALEANRRRQYHNSGTLPWQFNEPYPMAACTSAVDYYAQPKPVYYAVASAYEALHVSAKFPVQAWGNRQCFEAVAWVSNSTGQRSPDAVLELSLVGAGGKCYLIEWKKISIEADSSQPLARVCFDLSSIIEQVFFLDLKIRNDQGEVIATNRYIFCTTDNLAPFLTLPPTRLRVEQTKQDDNWQIRVKNGGEQAALFVWLQDGRLKHKELPQGHIYFDQNYFCLFPDEARTVRGIWKDAPLQGREVQIQSWNGS